MSEVTLKVENVHKFYGMNHALKGISFEVYAGRITGFLGPNGAGKTTTMKIITTFMPPSSGKVYISDGSERWEAFEEPLRTRRLIGYLPENFPVYHDLTVEEFLRFVARLRKVEKPAVEVDKVIELCGLKSYRRSLMGYLSRGYRQRVGLAQAIIGDPKILILDEPTQGLDPLQVIEIRRLIKELAEDRTVLLSTHIMQEVESLADDVIIINRGRILASRSIKELRASLQDKVKIEIIFAGNRDVRSELSKVLSETFGRYELSGPMEVDAVKGPAIGYEIIISGESEPNTVQLTEKLVSKGFKVMYINKIQETIEDIFVRVIEEDESRVVSAKEG